MKREYIGEMDAFINCIGIYTVLITNLTNQIQNKCNKLVKHLFDKKYIDNSLKSKLNMACASIHGCMD